MLSHDGHPGAQDRAFNTFANDKNKSEHRNDLAALRGYHYVTASEGSDGHFLDEELIKRITGCDPITVRELYGKPFTFHPDMKLGFQSNYQPTVRGRIWGMWRRLSRIRVFQKSPYNPLLWFLGFRFFVYC